VRAWTPNPEWRRRLWAPRVTDWSPLTAVLRAHGCSGERLARELADGATPMMQTLRIVTL
jgi:hypothetical protein